MFSDISASCTAEDLQFKLSSMNARGPTQRKDSTTATNLQPFDGFEFHSFLPSVNDFQASTWAGGHVTTPGVDCQSQSLAVSASKFFPETPMELPAAGHSQPKKPSSLQYPPSDGIPDPYFMTAVCPGCSAKFRTEADYRRHVACHPDHVTMSWRQ